MTTSEAATFEQSPDLLHELPDQKRECISLAFEALISAVREYSDSIREHWEGDEALICTCFGISESRIEKEIAAKRLTTIAEVTRECNAGAGCRSCYPLIDELLQMNAQHGVKG